MLGIDPTGNFRGPGEASGEWSGWSGGGRDAGSAERTGALDAQPARKDLGVELVPALPAPRVLSLDGC